jgi:UDP-N-acetylmuramoyl-tripeptide--D-alanyl-D-alanine ligase
MSYNEIKSGLSKYKPIEKRWEVEKIGSYEIINDSYNANPESMKAAVSTFLELYSNRVVVLGNMGELGENEIEFHKNVGEYIGKKYSDASNTLFITVGDLAQYIGKELEKYNFKVVHFNNNIETSRYILDNLHAGCTIFLKASRAMKFEEIVENIKRNFEK